MRATRTCFLFFVGCIIGAALVFVASARGQTAPTPVPRPDEPKSTTSSVSPKWYTYAVYLEQQLAFERAQAPSAPAPTPAPSVDLAPVLTKLDAIHTLAQSAASRAGAASSKADTILGKLGQVEQLVAYTTRVRTEFLGDIHLAWNDNSDNETEFIVERSADGGQTHVIAGRVGANVTTFIDRGLVPGEYAYRVKAANAAGDSAYTNIVQVLIIIP